jgi:hypothetical protein
MFATGDGVPGGSVGGTSDEYCTGGGAGRLCGGAAADALRATAGPLTDALGGIVDGTTPGGGKAAPGTSVARGPAGGMPGIAPGCGVGAVAACSDVPQLRQNRIPGGFSPRQAGQIAGNPAPVAGVFAAPAASAVPQFKQNDDPGGLSWPHIEQRIGLSPQPISQQRTAAGMASGRFTC